MAFDLKMRKFDKSETGKLVEAMTPGDLGGSI